MILLGHQDRSGFWVVYLRDHSTIVEVPKFIRHLHPQGVKERPHECDFLITPFLQFQDGTRHGYRDEKLSEFLRLFEEWLFETISTFPHEMRHGRKFEFSEAFRV